MRYDGYVIENHEDLGELIWTFVMNDQIYGIKINVVEINDEMEALFCLNVGKLIKAYQRYCLHQMHIKGIVFAK